MEKKIKDDDKKTTIFVHDDNGKIVFVMEKTKGTFVLVSGYGLAIPEFIGFAHITNNHPVLPESLVDFQYVDNDPNNMFSNSRLGTVRFFDSSDNFYMGESFTPNGWGEMTSKESAPNGVFMAAPDSIKALCGEHISTVISDSPKINNV